MQQPRTTIFHDEPRALYNQCLQPEEVGGFIENARNSLFLAKEYVTWYKAMERRRLLEHSLQGMMN